MSRCDRFFNGLAIVGTFVVCLSAIFILIVCGIRLEDWLCLKLLENSSEVFSKWGSAGIVFLVLTIISIFSSWDVTNKEGAQRRMIVASCWIVLVGYLLTSIQFHSRGPFIATGGFVAIVTLVEAGLVIKNLCQKLYYGEDDGY